MYLSSEQTRSLQSLMGLLAEDYSESEVRARVGAELLRLLGADYFASYVWDEARGVFDGRVAINMGDGNLRTYEQYFQHHDPITFQLQKCRGPTLVSQVMRQSELIRTEFFNDFLARDGLYHGVNLFAYSGSRNIGDLRIWRGRNRPAFDRDTLALLALVEPAFTRALERGASRSAAQPAGALTEDLLLCLSPRERSIARLLCVGRADKEIAHELDIAHSTIRTHVTRIFAKLGVRNRTELTERLLRPRP